MALRHSSFKNFTAALLSRHATGKFVVVVAMFDLTFEVCAPPGFGEISRLLGSARAWATAAFVLMKCRAP